MVHTMVPKTPPELGFHLQSQDYSSLNLSPLELQKFKHLDELEGLKMF
jgi:hypothetical protein